MDISNKPARAKKQATRPAAKNHSTKSSAPAGARARRSDEGTAFLPDPYDGAGAKARASDDLAETLA